MSPLPSQPCFRLKNGAARQPVALGPGEVFWAEAASRAVVLAGGRPGREQLDSCGELWEILVAVGKTRRIGEPQGSCEIESDHVFNIAIKPPSGMG